MDLEAIKTELRDASREDVDAVRIAAIIEQERRDNLDAIPEQIEQLAKKYREGGGTEQALSDALAPEQDTEPDSTASEHFDYLNEEN